MNSLRRFPDLPIQIEEDHHHVLVHILKGVGAKRLPLEDNVLIHFDSHPDLLLPRNLTPNVVMSKRELMDVVSIENWILPCSFMDIINRIVWICPPWSRQIPKGWHSFYIGEQISSGKLRVTCTESYFISEGIVCKREELKDEKQVHLLVVGIEDEDLTKRINDFIGIQDERRDDQTTLILDIDLDFYSTKNPFLELYSRANLYNRLKDLYVYEAVPDSLEGEAKVNFALKSCEKRTLLLDELEDVWQHLSDNKDLNHYSGIGSKHKDRIFDIKDAIETHYEEEIDWMVVHNAGCTCDDTDLPHHVSHSEEIDHFIHLTLKFLRSLLSLNRIKLITVARSSLDDFCPSDQVEGVQDRALNMLKSLFSDLSIHHNYLD